MPPTFIPEKEVAFIATVADGSVFCGACLTACFTAHTLASVWVMNLAFVTCDCLASSVVQFVVVLALGADAGVGAQLTVIEAGEARRHASVTVQTSRAVRHTATKVQEPLHTFLINSTGSAMEELVSAALGAGWMAEDALVSQ